MNRKEKDQSQTEREIVKDFPTAERERTNDWEYECRKSEHEREIERQLLPCPFCGHPVWVEALGPAYQDGTFDVYAVTCLNEVECGFHHLFDDDSPERLIQSWNRRAAKQE